MSIEEKIRLLILRFDFINLTSEGEVSFQSLLGNDSFRKLYDLVGEPLYMEAKVAFDKKRGVLDATFYTEKLESSETPYLIPLKEKEIEPLLNLILLDLRRCCEKIFWELEVNKIIEKRMKSKGIWNEEF